jgi:hypothetical protein
MVDEEKIERKNGLHGSGPRRAGGASLALLFSLWGQAQSPSSLRLGVAIRSTESQRIVMREESNC